MLVARAAQEHAFFVECHNRGFEVKLLTQMTARGNGIIACLDLPPGRQSRFQAIGRQRRKAMICR